MLGRSRNHHQLSRIRRHQAQRRALDQLRSDLGQRRPAEWALDTAQADLVSIERPGSQPRTGNLEPLLQVELLIIGMSW
jgi:hypothetical protein